MAKLETKIARRKKKQSQNKNDSKVLTFVDMSHLSYLSKSVAPDMHLTNKVQKTVILPVSTKMAIMEDDSEEDYASEEEKIV